VELIPHRWPGPPIFAELLERPNRFLARCRLGAGPRSGEEVLAHVPDRGRCLDLLLPGQPLVLVAAFGPLRTTRFTALLARARTPPSPWVSLDPAGAPRLVARALELGLLPSLRGLTVARSEVVSGHSRIDLLLEPGQVLCEVKSVGAARDGLALFPDAPTERGLRHLQLLAARARRGLGAAVVFCAQRGDVTAVAADAEIDPRFARGLQRAQRAGVKVAALLCDPGPAGTSLVREIPFVADRS